jgi:membrane carboxypeptidase/penicillin-binding protein PbpC
MIEQVIATIPKNSRECLRVGLGSFKGHELFSVRVWITTDDGKALPTQKGITCAVALLPPVIEALQATLNHARKTGVLPDVG